MVWYFCVVDLRWVFNFLKFWVGVLKFFVLIVLCSIKIVISLYKIVIFILLMVFCNCCFLGVDSDCWIMLGVFIVISVYKYFCGDNNVIFLVSCINNYSGIVINIIFIVNIGVKLLIMNLNFNVDVIKIFY